ncbi:uncharacterized protein TRIADDRAFT_15859, partial [Trichoplax adhaerens]
PEEPLQSDCCGQGCNPCVFDIYESDIAKWKKKCRRILNNEEDFLEDTTKNCRLAGIVLDQFTSLQIISIQKITEKLITYRFKLPNNKPLNLNPGQHLLLAHKANDFMLTRQYTPISSVDTVGYFDVFIKIYDNGKMSDQIRQWHVGDYAMWRGPYGDFQYLPNQCKKILMLAAGTGVAPMIQIIRYVINNENDDTLLHLILSVKYYDDIALKHDLDAFKQYWNVTVEYVLTCEKDTKKFKYGDKITLSKVDHQFLEKVLFPPSQNSKVLICGTKSFEKDMIKYLKQFGFTEENYFKF